MSQLHPAPLPASPALVEVDEIADLAHILDPWVHVAVWRRPEVPGIRRLLGRPEAIFGHHVRTVVRSGDPRRAQRIADLLPGAAHRADPEGASALVADIDFLCGMLRDLLAADELMVSLEAPKEASCPRFHVDRTGIRMLVTYRGPGTELLPHEFCDRRWLGEPGHGRPDEENGVMRPGARIETVDPFSVALLKGEAWPGAEGFGAVHRSPDPGLAARTLLRVDMLSQQPFSDGEETPW